MSQTHSQQFFKIIPLVVVVFGLLTYNFMSAQWQNPTSTPPYANTPAPINISANYQAKLGDLGAVRMRAGQYCNADGTVCVTAGNLGGGTWGTWTNVTASRPGGTWYRNTNSTGLAVHYWTNSGAGAFVSPIASTTGQVRVSAADGDSGEWGYGNFLVPPGHWYRIESSMRAVSELVLPF